jgi:alkanesulfonate monooxygenase SsuD/methylene tetrahydromethanopterin reductase-like flavin-dependent oxidoreductase (luciferase family)
LRRGTPGQIPPPIDDIETYWSPQEKVMASHMLTVTAVGSPETVLRGLQNFVDVMRPDELIMTAHLYDHRARVESFERVAGLRERITLPEKEVAAKS